MLKNKFFPLFPLLLALFNAAPVMGFGAREADHTDRAAAENTRARVNTQKPETIRVSGRVRLVGSSSRMSLVITGEKGEWYTEAKDRDKLMALQQRFVTVEGALVTQEMRLANGRYAGKRLILRDITVISSE
jgi:hypothetical protein